MRPTICPAHAADLADVEVYNAGIADRVATFETRPRTIEDISRWVEDGQPFIVAINDQHVVGWARAGAQTAASTRASASTPSTSTRPPAAADSAARS